MTDASAEAITEIARANYARAEAANALALAEHGVPPPVPPDRGSQIT